jgi:lysophospholipase L1-like esterase
MRSVLPGVVMAIVFAVALEATCRIDDAIRFGTPFWSPVESEDELLVRDATGEHGRPYARYKKWVINNVGMRGPNVDVVKPAGTLRVVTAGASETFGLYESPDHEFPRQLEDTLRAHMCDRPVEVLNAAIFGMTLPTLEQDLRLRVRPLHPDVVLLYPTPVQYLDNATPRPAAPDSAASDRLPMRDALYPRAAERLRTQLKQLLPGWLATDLRRDEIAREVLSHPSGWRFTGVPADRLAAYDDDLRRTIGTIHALGAAPVVAIHVNAFDGGGPLDEAKLISWENQYHRATGDALIAFDAAAARVTLRAARDSDVSVVDLRRWEPPAGARLFADYAHFTDAGAAWMASALTPAVLAAGHADTGCLERSASRP